MKIINCALCSKETEYEVLYKENFDYKFINEDTFSARRVPEKCHYRIVKCKECGLVFSNPILEEEEIKNLYLRSKFTYREEIENLKETYGHYLQKIVHLLPSKEKLLEIGCGNGFFLEEALSLGFKNVYGVEPSIEAVKKASPEIRRNIIVDVFKPGLYKNNYFDIVCFFQTLDHIIHPNDFLRNCYKILKKGGVVFCITHNTEAFSTRLLGERSPIFDIEHIYLFNKETLKRIFQKNEFEVVSVIEITNTYSLGYWIRMAPLPNFLKRLVMFFLSKPKIKNKKIALKGGNIGLIAKKC